MRLLDFLTLDNYSIDQCCGKINLNIILFSGYLQKSKRN